MFTWGSGEYGKLGHGTTIDLIHPKRIANFTEKVVKVSCGEAHTG